jgi:1-acyl-sn-glycerol-3-phosphate acyltransferase
MLTQLKQIVLGTMSLILYIGNCLLFPIPVILLSLLSRILPFKSWRAYTNQLVQKSPYPWTDINQAIFSISNRGKVDLKIEGELNQKHSYLLVSNHRSWIDILMIYGQLNRKTTPIKFFMKKQLLWGLPVAGITCKLIGFPFMERHSREDIRKNPALKGKDIETTRKACQQLVTIPGSLMNFAEGTRFSQRKKEKQASPYRHLLKPKAGGAAVVLEELHSHLAGVIDVTISYDTDNMSLWAFASGQFRKFHFHVRVLDLPYELIGNYHENRQSRTQMQTWLNDIWQHKDQLLDQLENK